MSKKLNESKFFVQKGKATLGTRDIPCDVKTGAILGVFNKKLPYDVSNDLAMEILKRANDKPLVGLVQKGGRNVEEVVDYLLCTSKAKKLKSHVLSDAITAVKNLYRRDNIQQVAMSNRIFNNIYENNSALVKEIDRFVGPTWVAPNFYCDMRTAYVISMACAEYHFEGKEFTARLKELAGGSNKVLGLFRDLSFEGVSNGLKLLLDTPNIKQLYNKYLVDDILYELNYCVNNSDYYLRVAANLFYGSAGTKVKLKCLKLAEKYGVDKNYIL